MMDLASYLVTRLYCFVCTCIKLRVSSCKASIKTDTYMHYTLYNLLGLNVGDKLGDRVGDSVGFNVGL